MLPNGMEQPFLHVMFPAATMERTVGGWLREWILDYAADEATTNSVIVGIVVALLATWSAMSSRERVTTRATE